MIENNNDEVLILGLPNSGKSTLVNVLTSKKHLLLAQHPTQRETKFQQLLRLIIKKL